MIFSTNFNNDLLGDTDNSFTTVLNVEKIDRICAYYGQISEAHSTLPFEFKYTHI